MRNHKIEGVILKRKNIGEADKLLTIFTKTNGKMQIKAPGIRKIASRRSPHVELLNRSLFILYTNSNGTLLTEVTMLADYKRLKCDLTKIGYAYHICEIVDGLCPENQENERAYALLVSTLDELCVSDSPLQLVHEFEYALLEILGFSEPAFRNRANFQIDAYIESIMERKLRSKAIFLSKH